MACLRKPLLSVMKYDRSARLLHVRSFEWFEPPRLCRRPQLVRSRVYDKQNDEQIFS